MINFHFAPQQHNLLVLKRILKHLQHPLEIVFDSFVVKYSHELVVVLSQKVFDFNFDLTLYLEQSFEVILELDLDLAHGILQLFDAKFYVSFVTVAF